MVRKTLTKTLCFLSTGAMAMPEYNMPVGVTPISHDIFHLHMVIFYICLAIAIGVFAAMFYIMINYRRSKGAKASHFHHNTWVEIIWTLIPTLILIMMAIPATKVLIDMNDDSKSDINIKIIGHQWHWEYSYLDEGVNFRSFLKTKKSAIDGRTPKGQWYLLEVDKPLVVPIHKKIRFLLTSADVDHSWWVPELGVKKDAIPGIINSAWARIDKVGIYRGQCTELCGMQHGFMPVVLIAVRDKDYQAWLKGQKSGHPITLPASATEPDPMTLAALMTQGKKVYEKKCAVCHKEDGKGAPPVYPAIHGSKVATGPTNAHIHKVLFGQKRTAMQPFGEQLTDQEIASVITYQRHSWGNDNAQHYGKAAGGLVQPKHVRHARVKKEF